MSKTDSEITAFHARYATKEKDIIIATNQLSGKGKNGGETLWTSNQGFIAYFDIESKQIFEVEDRLQWLDLQNQNFEDHFESEQIYLVKVRASLSAKAENYQREIDLSIITQLPDLSHHFMLVDILDDNIQNEQLQAILDEYKKPVVIENTLGKFTLDKYLGCFHSHIQWLDDKASFYLNEDSERSKTANICLKNLNVLIQNQQTWDSKLRNFAAAELTSLANDWQAEDDEKQHNPAITEQDFIKGISLSELVLYPDDSFEAYYDDGDMFWGHIIIISGNMNGTLDDASIAG